MKLNIGNVGWASVQGARAQQQDRYCSVLHNDQRPDVGFMGVFDAHGLGAWPSEFASSNFYRILTSTKEWKASDYSGALAHAFKRTDELLYDYAEEYFGRQKLRAGCTAITVIIDIGTKSIYSANLGDAKAILVESHPDRIVHLSMDHKPLNPEERLRITKAGGRIDEREGRIGQINVSRSLGDFAYKMPHVLTSSEPYISGALNDVDPPMADLISREPYQQTTHLTANAAFLIIGSDGIFSDSDGHSLEPAVLTHTRTWLEFGFSTSQVATKLTQLVLERSRYPDNATVGVVTFGAT